MNISDPIAIRAALLNLLARASSIPCSHGAHAFAALVPSTSRFQVALGGLLPIVEGAIASEVSHRVLAAFILYALYAPHPVGMNPFCETLQAIGARERQGGSAQLAWVLWKIVQGEGKDLALSPPDVLAQTLPPSEYDNRIHDLDEVPVPLDNLPSAREDRHPLVAALSVSSTSSTPVPRNDTTTPSDYLDATSRIATLLLDARERVLTLGEQKILATHLQSCINTLQASHQYQPQTQHPIAFLTTHDLPGFIAHNPSLAHLAIVALMLSLPSNQTDPDGLAVPTSPLPAYMSMLAHLPPASASFDVLGRLLQEPTSVPMAGGLPLAALVRSDVLGAFVTHAIEWVDGAAAEAARGLVADDTVARAVQNLCRFYGALVRLGAVDPAREADSAEMASFALRYAGFAEAQALYRTIAAAGSGLVEYA